MAIVGRDKLDHPALGTTGGAGLHTSIENIFKKVSDDLTGRWMQSLVWGNSVTREFEHNFRVPFADLRIHVYSVSGGVATLRSDFTFGAKSGQEQTHIEVTSPSVGGPFQEIYVYVQHAPMDDKLSKSGGTMTGAIAMGSSKITGLGAPTADTDASTKKYVDDQDAFKVSKAGDSMSGALAMGTNKITGLGTPTADADASTKKYVDDQDSLKLSLSGGTMSGILNMGNGVTNYKISNVADPASATDAATKNYVDSVAQGLDPKASVKAATTANITLSGAQTIDGVNIVAGDRVLVKNQTIQSQNGIYVCASGSWERSLDMDSWTEVPGAFVFIEQGSQADTGYVCTADQGGTIGTTAITWVNFAGAGSVTSGNAGIGVTGTAVSLVTDNSTLEVGGSGAQIKDLGVTNAKLAGSITQDKLAGSIPDSKLDTISTTGKVSGSAINSGTIGGSTVINTSGSVTCGNLTATGNATLGDTVSDSHIVYGDMAMNATGSLKLPSGSTAQRPGVPVNGMIRYNSTTGAFEGYASSAWSGIGGGGTVDKVNQVGHGFAVGDVLYINTSGVYVKALATAANTAEVVGMVSRIVTTDDFEITLNGEVSGLTGLTVGEVYFLSPSVQGGITTTEPTTVGQVSLPVGVASTSSTLYVAPKRGVVVGGANARTQISLLNNTANQPVQNVSTYDAGELAGWVYIDATTDLRFYVQAQFVRGGDNNYDISYQVSGDTPPAGFLLSITNAGVIQITMPSVTGFSSASINYALNAPAVGTNFPLSIDASAVVSGTPTFDTVNEKTLNNGVQIQGRKSGVLIPVGYIGEQAAASSATGTAAPGASGAWKTYESITLSAGVWLVYGNGAVYWTSSNNPVALSSVAFGLTTTVNTAPTGGAAGISLNLSSMAVTNSGMQFSVPPLLVTTNGITNNIVYMSGYCVYTTLNSLVLDLNSTNIYAIRIA